MNFKDKFQEWRFKKQGLSKFLPDYKIDKVIFNSAFLVFMIFLFYILYSHGFNFDTNIYVKCPVEETKGCKNPFYCPGGLCVASETLSAKDKQKCTMDWCKEPVISPGFEYGKKYDGSEQNLTIFAIFVFSIALVSNHLIHNKGYKLNVEDLD